MSPRTWLGRAVAVLGALGAACDDRDPFVDLGDPHAAVELWEIPVVEEPPPIVEDWPPDDMDVHDAGPPMDPDPAIDRLDPNQVYFFGTFLEGSCRLDAIAPVEHPARALVGFSCDRGQAKVRPTDGRLLYLSRNLTDDVTEVREFSCDGCVYHDPTQRYPLEPRANDAVVADAPCLLDSFVVGPDGTIAYRCDTWVDSSGVELAPGHTSDLLALGQADTMLFADGVFDRSTGTLSPLTGIDGLVARAVRVRSDGYWVAHDTGTQAIHMELWHVDFAGTATRLGVYGALPGGHTTYVTAVALDGTGRLLQVTFHDEAGIVETGVVDAVVERSIDGTTRLLYHEADDPLLRMDDASLVTGP